MEVRVQMFAVKTMRRGAVALALSLSMLAISVGQVLANGGLPPFPK